MKKEFRSIISLVVALAIMLGVLVVAPVSAFAQDTVLDDAAVVDDSAVECEPVAQYVQSEDDIEAEIQIKAREKNSDIAQTRKETELAQTKADVDTAQTSYKSGVWEYYFAEDIDENGAWVESSSEIIIDNYTGTATALNIPATIDGYKVIEVDFYYFSTASSIKSVYLPDSVKWVYGLYNLSNVSKVSVSSTNANFTVVDDILYTKDMTAMEFYPPEKTATSYTVPSTVEYVCIYDNEYLTSVSLSDAVEEVEIGGCPKITKLFVTKNVEYVDVYNCAAFKSFSVSDYNDYYCAKDGVLYDKYMEYLECYPEGKTSTTFTVPDTVKGLYIYSEYLTTLNLSTAAQEVDIDCPKLTKLFVTKNVKSIYFYNCRALKSISASDYNDYYSAKDGVLYDKDKTYIEEYPMAKTATSYTAPSTLKKVYIYDNNYLSKVTLSSATKGVQLYNCPKITSLTLTKNVSYFSLYGCTGIKSVSVSSSNSKFSSKDGVVFDKKKTSMEYYPPKKGATTYTVPSTVKEVYIDNNKNLEKISLSTAATSVILNKLTALTSITLKKNVSTCYIFGCTALKSISVSSYNKKFSASSGVLFNKDKTTLLLYPAKKTSTSYTVPSSVKTISSDAFASNKYIKKVTANKNVTYIAYGAFSNCTNLSSAYMSKKLTDIEAFAFLNCKKLKTLTVPKSLTYIGYKAYGYSNNSSTTYNFSKISDFRIRGYKGTAVETDAKYNNLAFTDITPDSVKLNKTSITLKKGKKYNLDETISPSNKVDKVKWTTSKSTVATVSSTGYVTAKKAGTATIKVTTSNGKTASCKVTVK